MLSPRSRVPFTLFITPPPDAPVAMARLLGLALIDQAFPLIHPTVMPSRPGFAILRDDDTFRHQVSRTLSAWVLDEISRLSNPLLAHGAALLAEIYSNPDRLLRVPVGETPFQQDDPNLFEFDLLEQTVDLSGFRRAWAGLKRHQLVRMEYERDRYMKHLPRSELDARAKTIFRGLYQVDHLGRITVANDEITHFWTDRMTEVMHEYLLRGIPESEYGASLATEATLARGRGTIFQSAGRVIGSYVAPDAPYLVKYGKPQHLSTLLKHGRLRLGPAASYDDPSLNPARRDHELRRAVDWDVSILPYAEDGRTPSYLGAPVVGRMQVTASAASNYYILCLSSALRARLFNDFEVATALVIRDADEFLRRLVRTIAAELPGWQVKAGPVQYYDPLNTSPSELRFPFWKDFGYAYQEEVRVAIEPPTPTHELPALFVELGSLEAIADIVGLKEKSGT